MEHIELVTVSSEADSDDDQEIDNEQENWTELTSCVDKYLMRLEGGLVERRYFYIIFLWDPVDRYLSDWRHVQRGATWKTAELRCGNQSWAKKCCQLL